MCSNRQYFDLQAIANGLGDWGSISDRVILKKKMVLDPALRNTQHYKVRIKGIGSIQGMEQPSYTLV